MTNWQSIPALKIALPLLFGTYIGTSWHLAVNTLLLLCLLLWCTLCVGHVYLRFNLNHSIHGKMSLMPLLIAFLLGWTGVVVQQSNKTDLAKNEANWIHVRLVKVYSTQSEWIRCQAKVLAIKDSIWSTAKGRLLLFIEKEQKESEFRPGTELVLSTKVQRIQEAPNRHQFDPKTFYASWNIIEQSFARKGTYKRLSASQAAWKTKLWKWKQQRLNLFDSLFVNDASRGMMKALTLADRSELPRETRAAFSRTGVMHVLAVSGLHVGGIYLSLMWLLPGHRKWAIIVRAILCLMTIWAYAWTTGLAPPVQRASIMISFLLVAQILGRKYAVYNALFLSAVIILVVDPLALYQLGFQYSFMALLSILLFSPWLQKLWKPRKWLLSKVWSLVSVSIAAQILSFPLGLYYFHFFPLLFILANVVVVFYVIAAFYLGMLILLLGPVMISFSSFGALLADYMLTFAMSINQLIAQQAFASVEGIILQPHEVALVYVLILVLSWAWSQRSMVLLLLVGAFLSCMVWIVQPKSQYQFVQWALSKDSRAWLLADCQNAFVVLDVKVLKSNDFLEYTLPPFLIAEGLKLKQLIPLQTLQRKADFQTLQILGKGVFSFGDRSFAIDPCSDGLTLHDADLHISASKAVLQRSRFTKLLNNKGNDRLKSGTAITTKEFVQLRW